MFSHMKRIDTKTKAIISDPKARAGWIIFQLKLKGKSLASVARQYGNQRQQPAKALRGPYPLWEQRLADELGLKPHELFPERYDHHGLPNRRMGRPVKSSDMYPKCNSRTDSGNDKQKDAC